MEGGLGGGGGVGMVREVCVVGGWGSVKMCNCVYGWKGAGGGGGGGNGKRGMCGWRMG